MDIGTSGVAPPDFKTRAEIADISKVPERTLEGWRLHHLRPPYVKLGRASRAPDDFQLFPSSPGWL